MHPALHPKPLQGDVDVARRFFGALASEPSGSRAALQEAVGALAGAYATAAAKRRAVGGADPGAAAVRVEEELRDLLLGALGSDQPAVRLCAIQVGLHVKQLPCSPRGFCPPGMTGCWRFAIS
jgi:hypothetical protein